MSLANLSQSKREELIVSLAALLLADCKLNISEENLNNVISTSGNSVPPYLPALFANFLSKTGGVESFLGAPSAGAVSTGAGAVSTSTAPAVSKQEKEEPKKEEESAEDLGGMDMFGGSKDDY